MEYLIEFILELFLEGGIEATKCKKIPKTVRYLILGFIIFLFIIAIGLVYLTAFLMLKESVIGFMAFFVLASYMLIYSIVKFKKEYLKINNK